MSLPPNEPAEQPFDLATQEAASPAKERAARKKADAPAKKGATEDTGSDAQILSYRHPDRRANNPEVGMVTPATDPEAGKTRWRHQFHISDPHLAPELRFDAARSQVERLIDDALAGDDPAALRAALEELKRRQSPYLSWAGKAEGTSFAVDLVSLHVHERIDPMSILSALRKGEGERDKGGDKPAAKAGKPTAGAARAMQPGLFDAPFENLPFRDAVDFYKHDKGWSNRLVAGDSLLVMNSLLQKESLAGQVQMIYIDPPYGIKYGSNFQPFVNKRDVKDRKDEDLTQEPEMVKAFRDTWELGIHSYLTYLRDRLLLARELLSDSGSVFVQISDENLHHVREIMDEVLGAENFVSIISFRTTSGFSSATLSRAGDYVCWYAKDHRKVKYRPLLRKKGLGEAGTDYYNHLELPTGEIRPATKSELQSLQPGTRPFSKGSMTSAGVANTPQEFEHCGRTFSPGATAHWKASFPTGMERIAKCNRISINANTLKFKRYIDDFEYFPFDNLWIEQNSEQYKSYVVQTSTEVIQRCLLMTTDPGDLVLDPTCGSGTTAYVAEKWGRRWISCDTSRVAVTLAKQRLMTASFDYYELRYPHEGLRGGFIYKTVPHVTLKSIANNPEIDEIYARLHPAVDAALAELNRVLKAAAKEWEVPFDFPAAANNDPAARAAFDAFHAARQSLQKAMDEAIARHADQETLYDQPAKAKDKLRVTGPFSVEAVPFPTVLALDEAEAPAEADAAIARAGESSRQHQWRDELLKTGIRGVNKGAGGQMLKFAELETLPGTKYLHASGHLESGERVVVSFGPEHAALEQRQVALALQEAGELFPLPKMIVFCAFTFDPEAAKDIDHLKGIVALKAQMNTDLLTEDLKKARASNQSFWLMGQPDVELRRRDDGLYEVEVHGFDYFDTAKGELISGGKAKIAMWSLDTDYDDRSLFPRQVFFPMAGKGEGWEKLKKDIRAELDDALLPAFHGTLSLPFARGENGRVAVKIVDDRGIESLKVMDCE